MRLTFRAIVLAALAGLAFASIASAPAGGGSPPNDPYSQGTGAFGSFSWGMEQIRVLGAWEATRGAGVTVAILDTGIDLDHPDLAPNLVPGVDFVDCDDLVTGCGDGHWDPDGDGVGSAHGTYVAGIVAAVADNGIGVFGVAPEAKLMPVRVTGDDDTNIPSEVLAGMRWAIDHGADVLNLSFTSTFDSLLGDPGFEDVIADAVDRGVTIVAAAGNRTVPLCERPSFINGALCVIATGANEERSSYSSGGLGAAATDVVAAPGGIAYFCDADLSVLSTWPDELPAGSACPPYEAPGYRSGGGTSAAAPHVAGVAALLHAVGCERDQVMQLLRSSARQPHSEQRGVFTPAFGWGIVDASAAIAAAGSTCDGALP